MVPAIAEFEMEQASGKVASQLATKADDGLALLALIASHVDKHLLEQIAAANDTLDQTRHLVALVKIWKSGRVAVPFQKYPQDVLDIARNGKLGHLATAFSCAAMLHGACGGDVAGTHIAVPDVVAQLILSLKDLSFKADNEAQKMIAALPATDLGAAERVLLESAKLWFALRGASGSDAIVQILENITHISRQHFDTLSANWGLMTDELALPDMAVLAINRASWQEIAELMCDMDFSQLDRCLADKAGIHAELLRRAMA
jgi:hypothetical protein